MILENLNEPQKEAVITTDGPLLVLAGAGTGKTKVLTSRVVNIVNSFKASPFQILAVTFTNKASKEMKNRIGDIIGDQVNNLWIGTFHSIASKILRRHPEVLGLRSDFIIIDSDDQTRLLKQILGDLNIDPKQFAPKVYLNKISRYKDKMVLPQNLDGSSFDVALPNLKDVYSIYQRRLKEMNAVDFGDLLMHNLTLFASAPDVLKYYQDKFRYVLVDEYQDTNNTQYQWLLQLVDTHKNICCVGDDDQSIYSWRGANVENILRFEKDFKGAKVIRLEQNYRSTSKILNVADAVISNNKERHGKKLWTNLGEGEKIKVLAFNDDRNESLVVAGMINDVLKSRKYNESQIAVLVRAGYQTRSFEEAFIQNGISYKVVGGMKFYDRAEVRDAISYLRIVANFNDDLALNRIINLPKRGFGAKALSNLYNKSKEENISLFESLQKSIRRDDIKGKTKEILLEFVEKIESANQKVGQVSLDILAKSLLKDLGYIDMYKAENTVESQGKLENLEEFFVSLADFSNMTEFLEYVSLVESKDDTNQKASVNIMTIHGAKGLEFDLVFVPGLEDGLFPSSRSVDERNGLEEERRLMYVAITRAKKELVLSYTKNRYLYGEVQAQMPSRFIKELPESEIEFREIFFGNEFSYSKSSNNSFGAKTFGSGNFVPKASGGFGSGSISNSSSGSSSIYSSAPIFKKSSSSADEPHMNKRVFHQKFGYGKVISVNGNKLEIAFEKTGIKTVLKDFVSLA